MKGNQNDYEIYKYGFQATIEQGLFIITCIIIALFLHSLGAMLLFLLVFHLIRPYVGGFHFKNFIYCYLLSVVSATGVILLPKIIIIPIDLTFCLSVVLCGVTYLSLLGQAPNMEFRESEYYKKKLRRNLIIIVGLNLVGYMLNIPIAVVTITLTMLLTTISFLMVIVQQD
ncbi:MAG: accessory gene regulator B family protein [Eubacteriales bacterium]